MKGNIDAPLTELNSLKLKKFKVKKISLNSHTIFWICLHAKPHLFVFNLVPFRAFFSHLGSLGIFGEGRFKNFFVAYYCRKATLGCFRPF